MLKTLGRSVWVYATDPARRSNWTQRGVRLWSLALVMLLGVSGTAHGQDNALPFFHSFTVPGNYVAAGIDLLPGSTQNGTITGTIQVSGVPQNAKIVAAYMYWEMIWSGGPDDLDSLLSSVRFRGQPVTAVTSPTIDLTMAPYSPCWSTGAAKLTMMRADVLRLLPPQLDADGKWTGNQLVNHADLVPYQNQSADGNWLLTVTLPEAGNGNQLPQSAGASLVIVYAAPTAAPEPLRTVVIYDGAHVQGPGETTYQRISGFLQSAASPGAKLTHLVGSGAPNATDRVWFDANPLAPSATSIATNPFVSAGGGSSDRAWSTVTFSAPATPLSMPGTYTFPYGEEVATRITHTSASPYDCLASAAIVFSTAVEDSDHDGLIDRLETTSGLESPDGEPLPNISQMGAVVGQRDLFVEIGAMYAAGHDHMPSAAVLQNVTSALASAGVAVHVDVGQDLGTAYRTALGLGPDNTSIIAGAVGVARGGEKILETTCSPFGPNCRFPGFPGTVSWPIAYQYLAQAPVGPLGEELSPAQELACRSTTPPAGCGRRRFDKNRDGIFHYVSFYHSRGIPKSTFPCLDGSTPVESDDLACPGLSVNPDYYIPKSVSGVSETPGRYSMVTLGQWDNSVGTEFMQASTLLHEVAHSLDIWHGGAPPTFTSVGNGRWNRFVQPNCKPNYFSSTSYLWQAAGLRGTDGVPHIALSGAVHGLSAGVVNEASLFDASLTPTPPYRAAWYAPVDVPGTLGYWLGLPAATKHCDGTPLFGTEGALARIDAMTAGSLIDWRGDAGTTTGGIVQDVNFDGTPTVDGITSGVANMLTGFNDYSGLALNRLGTGRNMGLFSLGLDLGGLDLGGLDLGGLDLGGLDLGGLDLGGLDLGGLDLGGLDLGGLDLGGLDLGGLDLGGLDLGGLDLGGLDLGGLDLGGSELDRNTAIESSGGTAPNALKAFNRGTTGAGGTDSSVAAGSNWVPSGEPTDCSTLTAAECHRVRLDWDATNVGPVTSYTAFRGWDPTGTADMPSLSSPVATVKSTPDGESRTVTDDEELPNGQRFIYFVRARIEGALRSPSNFAAITARNAAPVAVADSYTTPSTAPRTLTVSAADGVLKNDTDEDSANRANWKVTLVSDVSNGTLLLNADGSFTYTPNASFTGPTDSFTYKVNNGTWSGDPTVAMSPDSNTVTVTITIGGGGGSPGLVYGFVPLKNLPPSKAQNRGSAIPLQWQFTLNGTVVCNTSPNPIIRVTGPSGNPVVTDFTAADPGKSSFKPPSPPKCTWEFNWQTVNANGTALPAGNYTVQIGSQASGQFFPGVVITLK